MKTHVANAHPTLCAIKKALDQTLIPEMFSVKLFFKAATLNGGPLLNSLALFSPGF